MASTGRSARLKGGAFERLIANKLTSETGLEWKRGLAQSRGGGAEGSDVGSSEVPEIHIECKNHIRTNIKAALRQAIDDSKGSSRIPIAMTKDSRSDILVTMRLDDWLLMFKPYLASRS